MKATFLPAIIALLLSAALNIQAWDPLAVDEDPLLFMPGTQPDDPRIAASDSCTICHGQFEAPDHGLGDEWHGSMMAQAGRDPLWLAALTVAAQDSIWALGNPNATDLCLRCHAPGAWLAGRSDPTNGTALDVSEGDFDGVNCAFCHQLVDPFPGLAQAPYLSPESDPEAIAAAEDTLNRDLEVLQAVTLFDGSPFLDLESRLPIHYGEGRMPAYREATAGQFFVDSDPARRGQRYDGLALHEWKYSRFHATQHACAVCHDVSNPVLANLQLGAGTPERQAAGSYFHVERTWSEFSLSAYGAPGGAATNPPLAGQGPDWASKCQDCHMETTTGVASRFGSVPEREDLRRHTLAGGNAWITGILASLDREGPVYNATNDQLLSGQKFPGAQLETAGLQDLGTRLLAGQAQARANLRRAASIEWVSETEDQLVLRLVNHTGHKLISGFPEGRRMWLEVAFYDASGAELEAINPYHPLVTSAGAESEPVYESGGDLEVTRDDLVYEVKLSSSLTGEDNTFHFVLATDRYKDNRIPPKGFRIAEAGERLVDPRWRGEAAPNYFSPDEYAGGYDEVTLDKPAGTAAWKTTLYYQTTSKDYIEFLRDEIRGAADSLSSPTPSGETHAYIVQSDPFFASLADWGEAIWQLWLENDGAAPQPMAVQISALRIAGIERTEDRIRLQLPTIPGMVYQVQYADDLPHGEWINLGNPQTGDGAVIQIDDAAGVDQPQRYYRIQATVSQEA